MAIDDWMQGDGTDALVGSTPAHNIDDNITAYIQDPLNLLLAKYKTGCALSVASTTTLNAGAGEVVCSDSTDAKRRFRRNSAAITAAIDTGSLAASTTYYVYLKADSDVDTNFTSVYSLSDTSPDSSTYYRKVGYLVTNSSSEITNVNSYLDAGPYAQIVMNRDTGVQTITSAPLWSGASIPTTAGGAAYDELDTLVVPASSTSRLLIECTLQMRSSVGNGTGAQAFLFVDSEANALSGGDFYCITTSTYASNSVKFNYIVSSASTNARTYKIRVGFRNNSGEVNAGANGDLGEIMGSSVIVYEVR